MTKRTIGFILLIALLTLSTFNLVTPEQKPAAKSITKKEIKIIQKQTDKIEKEYQQTIAKLLVENDSLKLAVNDAKNELKKSKTKMMLIRTKVIDIILSKKAEIDSSRKLAYCDSLESEVANLVAESSQRDSLCDSTISVLSAQVQNRDSSFSMCEESYLKTQELLSISLQQQEQLAKCLGKAQKIIKRKNIQSRLLAGGAMILTGFFIHEHFIGK